ncbi:MAG TPA: tetratricopeptide repeat protein [Gemmataceae bacterium]|jgi:tetratricopeptide (TPR) repeat protein|nr:tetratricopeptide repeat protein [Gemmataceae bacterium]
MPLRHPRALLCLLGLLLTLAAAEPAAPPTPALSLWQEGQKAMGEGRTDDAIAAYERSVKLDPGLARNYLSLAAAHLARGEDERAVPFLARYVADQPDHLVVRAHYAELLLRLKRPRAAREQFERFVADAQDDAALARQHLVHCHSRLMEIAEGEEDDYGEHLHRGIGLYLLACQGGDLEDGGGPSVEGTLFKAIAELTLARLERPGEARPCWYLYAAWTCLAQQQPAARWLRSAAAAAPLSDLTPSEQRQLQFACRRSRDEGRWK